MKGLRQSNKGFTLVELCVTLVIFTILVSTAVFGLVQWQAHSTYMQENENAELIYMAAKNKISKLISNNVIEEVPLWGKNGNNNIVTKSNISDYSSMTAETIYFAKCKIGDYNKYSGVKNKLNSDDSANLLFDLIEDYIFDPSLLNASICIEYTGDGRIMAVLYSDRCDEFSYGASSSKVDISIRTEEKLEENMVGYHKTY